MLIVTLQYNGSKYFLRNTIWTAYLDRATEFPSREAARFQLDKAKQFMKAAQYKAAKIEEKPLE